MTDFSYQLYSSRNFPPLSRTLVMLARLGYGEVEGYHALYADPAKVAELAELLELTGLRMPTGHFGLEMIEEAPDRVIEIARLLGIGTVYCPTLPPDVQPDTGVAWEILGHRLAAAGKPILMEKPVERTLEAAERLCGICETAGVTLGIVFQHRMRPAAQELARIVAGGRLGTLRTVEVAVPSKLSDEERAAIEALAEVSTASPREHLLAETAAAGGSTTERED